MVYLRKLVSTIFFLKCFTAISCIVNFLYIMFNEKSFNEKFPLVGNVINCTRKLTCVCACVCTCDCMHLREQCAIINGYSKKKYFLQVIITAYRKNWTFFYGFWNKYLLNILFLRNICIGKFSKNTKLLLVALLPGVKLKQSLKMTYLDPNKESHWWKVSNNLNLMIYLEYVDKFAISR